MKVLIDGREVPCLTDVKVIFETDTKGHEFHVTLNHKGRVYDYVVDGEVDDTDHSLWVDVISDFFFVTRKILRSLRNDPNAPRRSD